MTSRADLTQLAAQTRLTGELLDAHGRTAWDTTTNWQAGPQATNTDPHSGGNRWWTDPDTGQTFQVPNDPTGDQATQPTPPDTHTHYRQLLTELEHTTTQLIHLLRQATPTMPNPPKQHILDAGLAEDGYCVSCHRDNKHCWPIERRAPDYIIPYYAQYCRWCGDFKRNNGQLPPLEILRVHHAGTDSRISQAAVTQALNKTKNQALRRKKKRRKTA